MESHIVTRLAAVSIETCAACVVMNARAIAMAIEPESDGDAWIPACASEYAAILMRVIRTRMSLESAGRNESMVGVLTALEDDGIAIYATFLTSDAEKQALSRLRDSFCLALPDASPDPATAVFERVQEMRSLRVPNNPWLYWHR